MATIAAIATPAGRGGLGVIRISGPDAYDITQHLCGKQQPWKPRTAHLSSFLDADGKAIDKGVVLYFMAPHSYTGEDVVELQAHGSPLLLNALLQRTLVLGARLAAAGEFTRRAVENGKMNLEQAEAVAACIDAATMRAARQAQKHLRGEFGKKIEMLMHQLTGAVAHVEACLDFPEEDVPDLLFGQLREQVRQDIVQPIEQMLQHASFGELLFNGANIAIIGAPNVGKSSLLNRLAGRERAIVSDIAGTTRDLLEVDLEAHGIPLRLIDTAGLRLFGKDAVEAEGIQRAKKAAKSADAVIFVADITRPETWADTHDADIRLMNKVDLKDETSVPTGFFPVSLLTGEGLQGFVDRLAMMLGDMPAQEEGLLITCERHRLALQNSRECLLKGLVLLKEEGQIELVALEWRRAWSFPGEITGVGDVEQILNRFFSEFCIGK